jgi:hypothetical protein
MILTVALQYVLLHSTYMQYIPLREIETHAWLTPSCIGVAAWAGQAVDVNAPTLQPVG